jgi:hypothetical protein
VHQSSKIKKRGQEERSITYYIDAWPFGLT